MPEQGLWGAGGDFAEHLRIAKGAVYRRIESRGLPTRPIGWLRKFEIGDVDEQVRVSSVAEPADSDPTGGRRTP